MYFEFLFRRNIKMCFVNCLYVPNMFYRNSKQICESKTYIGLAALSLLTKTHHYTGSDYMRNILNVWITQSRIYIPTHIWCVWSWKLHLVSQFKHHNPRVFLWPGAHVRQPWIKLNTDSQYDSSTVYSPAAAQDPKVLGENVKFYN